MPDTTQKYIELNQGKKLEESFGELSMGIKRASRSAENEATVVSAFEIHIFSFINKHFNKKVFPIKERVLDTERRISRGRIDSKYGAFIIEFKHYSKLKSNNQKVKAVEQLSSYLESLYQQTNQDYLGLVTDGLLTRFIRIENGELQLESWIELSANILDRIVRAVLSLDQVSLTPKNLIRDFCEPYDTSVYQRLGSEFYSALTEYTTGKTLMLYKEWKELFRLAHDDKTKQKAIEERKKELGQALKLKVKDNEDEYKILYALQTTYALIVKLIAYKVVSNIHFNSDFIKFNDLATYDSNTVQLQLLALEDGDVFKQAGILNLLEGDFFSWYCAKGQWSEKIYLLVKEILETLSKYEDKVLLQEYSQTRDLFKELYERIIPAKVRYSLGEFYTPPWLADSVISEALKLLNIPRWKSLDPCAGSGTFITNLIQKILNEQDKLTKKEKLNEIITRVKAIDLNPLAVLTTRVNYFVNISLLIDTESAFQIPVYLGDASYVPEEILIDKVPCLKYQIKTLKGYLDVILPKNVVSDAGKFSETMSSIETDIKARNEQSIIDKILKLTSRKDLTKKIKNNIKFLAKQFIELEKNEWNGIWARIVTNFLTTANLGQFDLVVSNPPWIDWKSLPEGYRERIKGLCIDRHLFSGDRITGGINLNICALIANVSAENWLTDNGVLAFLMPENLIFQQTYEGFRNFYLKKKGERLYLQQITDWTRAGYPFKPVQHRFLSYFYNRKTINYSDGIKVDRYKKKVGVNIETINRNRQFDEVVDFYTKENLVAGTTNQTNSSFSYAKNTEYLHKYALISGKCYYIGREGVEFYPQELFLLIPQVNLKAPRGLIYLKNFQNPASKYNVPEQTILLEKKYLFPLVKGVDVEKFHLNTDNQFFVPFPYSEKDTRLPLSLKELQKEAPLLTRYLLQHKDLLESQTEYNAKIIGKKGQEFYALARVGKYSFYNIHVAYRDNTKWFSTVVSDINVNWDKPKRALFQNHAPSICEGGEGELITLEEAHYISGILNAPITVKFITDSSDLRTFKVRPPVYIPKYDPKNILHKKISKLSYRAHSYWDDANKLKEIETELDSLYLSVAKNKK